MSSDLDARTTGPAELPGRLTELSQVGVLPVRLQYAALHGICRGKDIPISAFPHAAEDGIGFVAAIMTVDLRHNVVAGFEGGFPDLLARPDLETQIPLPWQPDVVACLVDLEEPATHQPSPVDPRGALKRVLAGFSEYGVSPIVGPELEFYLCEPDPLAPNGYRPYASQDSPVYTVGGIADPQPPRVRPRPVRDQPAPRPGAQFRRPSVSLQGDGQGDGGP